MGTVEHGRRVTIAGIVLSVLTRSSILLASDRSSRGVRPVDGVGWDKGSLGGDRMEEALLIESDAILATTIGRTVIPRATNLENY